MWELDVDEVTPGSIIPRLDRDFLESQSDGWILRLYEFLKGQSALWNRLQSVPLIRLEDGGRHVTPKANGQPQAFLPSDKPTRFPTVRPSVCQSETARKFLESLGLRQVDPVDQVIGTVLRKFHSEKIDDAGYEADIELILNAFDTDSHAQQAKLIDALRQTPFVRAVDAGADEKRFVLPGEVNLATERLKELFDGVEGVLLVDDTYKCLRGQKIQGLLEACGAARHLRPIPDESLLDFSNWSKLDQLRGERPTSRRNDRVKDWRLVGLNSVLDILPRLSPDQQCSIAKLLWNELTCVSKEFFTGEYTWTYRRRFKEAIDPTAFVRKLNETAWVPGANGELKRPATVLFDDLDWEPNRFLQSKIPFKSPPKVEELAREVGVEPKIINFIKERNLTLDELQTLLPEKNPGTLRVERRPTRPDAGSVRGVADPQRWSRPHP